MRTSHGGAGSLLPSLLSVSDQRIPRNSAEYFEHFEARLLGPQVEWDRPGPTGLTPREAARLTTGDDAKGLSEYAKQY